MWGGRLADNLDTYRERLTGGLSLDRHALVNECRDNKLPGCGPTVGNERHWMHRLIVISVYGGGANSV